MMLFGDHTQGIFIAWTTFMLGTLSPGPALLSTMGTAMSSGRRAGLALGLGVCCGSFTWALLAALGLPNLLILWSGALKIVRIFGVAYLTFLAWKALRSALSSKNLVVLEGDERKLSGHFFRGWGLHITNPKGALTWIAVIAVGMKPGAPFWVAETIIGGAMAYAVIFYSLAAAAFSTSVMVRRYTKARRIIDACLGAFYLFAAWTMAFR